MTNMIKRGQIQSNVIMYALIGIVAVMVLLFGYKTIKSLSGKADEADLINLKADLKKDFSNVKYGVVKERSYRLPQGINGICFVDRIKRTDCAAHPLLGPSCTDDPSNPLIRNIIDDTTRNVILKTDNVPESVYIERLRLNCCNYHCAKKKGNTVEIKIKGMGELILVE